jgi:hypothetical protein
VRVAQRLRIITTGPAGSLPCFFRTHSQRATISFTTMRVTAPTAPPRSESSGPMMAFWTTFDSRSTTTKSDAVSWAASRLARRINR